MKYSGHITNIEVAFYCEGPAVDSFGNFYITNLSGGQILKVSEGRIEEWARSVCPNGQVILKNDDHLICDSKLGSIRRFDKNGNFVNDLINGTCAGRKIQVPNDLTVDKNQGVYFTDSVRGNGCVGYLGKNGEEYIIAEGLDYPNGLALSADEKYLYVAESYKNRIVQFLIDKTNPEIMVLANLPSNRSGKEVDNLPDGLKIDHLGNLWVAHYGMGALQIISKKGEFIGSFEAQVRLPSNLCFNNERLLITGGVNEPGPGMFTIINGQ